MSNTLPIEFSAGTGAIDLQGASRPHRVRPDENPILPRREPPEDPRMHGLAIAEAQVSLKPRQRIRGKRAASFDGEPDLVRPIQLVGREGDQAELQSCLRRKRLPDT